MANLSVPNREDGTDRDALKAWGEGGYDLLAALTSDPIAALQFCQSLVRTLTTNTALSPSNGRQPLADTSRAVRDSLLSEPNLSVVIAVYNEEENLPTLCSRLTSVLKEVGLDYEIVFVDDGSRDMSLELLHRLAEQDSRVTVVGLARNFGHQVAISAGLDYSRGSAVIVMDADLQDPPEVLPQFIDKWREGYDVVYGIRRKRKENVLKRIAYKMFYRMLKNLSDVDIPLDSGDFCIMDRRVVDQLKGMPERNRFVRGIRSWVGFRQIGLQYERDRRYAGKVKYTFFKLLKLAFDGFVSFSYVPLRIASILGLLVSVVSFGTAMITLYKKLTIPNFLPGFTTVVVAIMLLGGVQLIAIGIMGEYIGRTFDEVKQRPLYTIDQVVGFDE